MNELEFRAQFLPSGPVTVGTVVSRLAVPGRDELLQDVAEKKAADARSAQREDLALANQAAGDPLGQIRRYETEVSELHAEVADLESRLTAVRSKLHVAASNLVHVRDAAGEVQAAVARSGNPQDLLTDARRALSEARAEAKVDAMLAERRAHPKGQGPGGHAVRGKQAECEGCRKVGFDQAQSEWAHKNVMPAGAGVIVR